MRRTNIEVKRTLLSRLLRFAGWFALFLVVVALLWPFVAPAYNRVIVGGASLLLAVVEEPNVSVVRADAGTTWIYRRVPGISEPQAFSSFNLYTYVGLVPLAALFLATPGLGWKRRGMLAGAGVLLFMLFHIVYLVLTVKLLYVFCGLDEVGSVAYHVYDWAQIMVRVVWEASAVLLWAALTFGHWKRIVSQTAGGSSSQQPFAFWKMLQRGLQRG